MIVLKRLCVFLIIICVSSGVQAANLFLDDTCKLKGYGGQTPNGLAKMSQEHRDKVFYNRFSNKGKGNGGESLSITADLETGDNYISCIKTADEATPGTINVCLFNCSVIIPDVGTWPESDPNDF